MKKTWILLVLAALLVFALAMPATASVTDPHCPCGATTSGTTCASCGLPVYSDWTEWDQGTSPHFSDAQEAHHYYLTEDLHLAGEMWVKDGVDVTIDLNGFDIYADGKGRHSRYCLVDYYDNNTKANNVHITITDTSAGNTGEILIAQLSEKNGAGAVARIHGTGCSFTMINASAKIVKGGTAAFNSVMFNVNAGNSLNFYNAKIDASNIKTTQAAIGISNSPITIKGANTVMKAGTATTDSGGIRCNANVTVHDGTFYGGTAPFGGFMYIAAGGNLTIYDGTFDGGTATSSGGGAICFQGTTMNMTGGTIRDGKYTTGSNGGGNLCVFGGNVYLKGGTIENGTSTKDGGNIYVNAGTLHLQGTNVKNGDADNFGGNIFTKVTVNHSAGTVENGNADKYGGNVWLNNNATATYNLSGTGKITAGTAATGGGNVGLFAGCTFNMEGGTISDGVCTGNGWGANVHMNTSGTFKMSAGTISGGNATCGSVYSRGGSALIEISGTAVVDASAMQGADNGAAFCIEAGTVDIKGGTVTGGNCNQGGAIFMNNGTVNITGGIVNGGNANTNGGTIFVCKNGADKTPVLSISDGTVNAGTAETGRGIYIADGTVNVTGGTTAALSKFGGTLNVSDAPKISIALNNNQSFYIPAAITANVGISCDDWSDVIAVAASKEVAVESKPYLGQYPDSLVLENDTNIRMAVLQTFTDGVKGGLYSPAATLAGGKNITYKMTYNLERANLNDMADGTVVDLNGFTLTLTDAKDMSNVILVDSTAAGYTAGTGKVAASGVTGQPKRAGVDTATKYRYVTILDGGNYTAHRIYVGIKSAVLNPYGPSVNFRTILKCDDVVAAKITQHGAKFTGDNTITSASTKDIVPGKDATNDWLTKLANASAANFTQEFNSYAFFTIADAMGTEDVESSKMPRSIKAMVEYGNTNFATLTPTQKAALVHMYKTYSSTMAEDWNIEDIINEANKGVSTT